MKYNTLHQKSIKKLWNILMTKSHYINDLYNGSCDKQIFIRRSLKSFVGKYYMVIDKRFTGNFICSDKGDINSYYKKYKSVKTYIRITDIFYSMNINDSITIAYNEVANCVSLNMIELNFNDMLDIHFHEITKKEFDTIDALFIDDRDMQQFEYYGFKKDTMKKVYIIIEAKDASEGIVIAREQNPNIVIYGLRGGECDN